MDKISIGSFYQLSFYDKFKANLYRDAELRNIITIRDLKLLLLIKTYNELNNNIGITLSVLSNILELEPITLSAGKLPRLQNRQLIYWIKSLTTGKMIKRYHLTGNGRHLLNLIDLYYAGYYLTLRNKVTGL